MRYHGEVHARHEAALSFRAAGKIAHRAVNLGETVQAGQVLASLDPADARLAAAAAEAALKAAEDQRDLARLEYTRAQDLAGRQLISQSAFDARETEYRIAEARLREARNRAALSRNQAAYTDLKAEHDGVITAVLADTGEVVSAGQPVFGFARSGERELWIDVPENWIDAIATGEQLTVTFWALPDVTAQGRVREIAADADAATRTYRVRITLLEPDPQIKLGMSADAVFTQASSDAVAVLPLTSLYHADGKPAVWVVDPQTGSVALRAVHVLRYRDDAVVLGEGLQAGERVVVKGVHKLHAGQIVRPVAGPGDAADAP